MVLAAVILLLVVGGGLLAFRGSITAAANKAFKSDAERNFELDQQKEKAVKEKTAQEKLEERGLFGQFGALFVGESELERVREAGAKVARENAIIAAEKQIEKQAKDAGFSSVEDFNRATDSGAVVIGGKRMIVDFGRIGDVSEAVKSPQRASRFGGQR